MASKLHRKGLSGDVASWEPPLRPGAQPVQSSGVSAGFGALAANSDERTPDFERQAEQREQSAYRRGVQDGETNARAQAATHLESAIERLSHAVAEMADLKPRLRHEAEEDVVKLAVAISRRILYREIATDPDALRGLVRAALDRLDAREVSRVRVHPLDAPSVNKHIQALPPPVRIEVSPDPALDRGAAIFETANGSFDASVSTQLNEIERGFADLVRRSS